MITRAEWISVVRTLAVEMGKKGTVYRWKSPVNEKNSMKEATCVSFVGLALQRADLLPDNTYINFQDTGNLHGPGAAYVKKHPEIFTIIENVGKSPKAAGLQVGDIVGYKSHIMIFAGWKGSTPLWYSLERNGSNGIGKKPRIDIAGVFSYYNTRAINGGIVRIKFGTNTTVSQKPKAPVSPSKPVQTATKYKLKQTMNLRDKANGKKVICTVPKGAVLTQQSKAGYWIKTTYCGHTGWVCCGTTKYATKL